LPVLQHQNLGKQKKPSISRENALQLLPQRVQCSVEQAVTNSKLAADIWLPVLWLNALSVMRILQQFLQVRGNPLRRVRLFILRGQNLIPQSRKSARKPKGFRADKTTHQFTPTIDTTTEMWYFYLFK
jgi:hypothetical protein